MNLNLIGIVVAKTEELLVAEIVDPFLKRFAQSGIDFVRAFDRGRLRVIGIFILPHLKLLRSGFSGQFRRSDRSGVSELRSFQLGIGAADIHFCVR